MNPIRTCFLALFVLSSVSVTGTARADQDNGARLTPVPWMNDRLFCTSPTALPSEEVFNDWLGECGSRPYADLAGRQLSGRDLGGSYFFGTDLSRAQLEGAYLVSANCTDGKLDGANLAGADLTDAVLSAASLNGANFSRGTFLRTSFYQTSVDNTDFAGANLKEASFFLAHGTNVNFEGAHLEGAMLVKELQGLRVTGAYYDSETTLPFSNDEALARGMIFVP